MNSGLSQKGRAWDSPIEPVFETISGDFATPKELFQRGVPNSKLSRIPVGMRFLRRVHHEHTIEVDEHGWAYCPVCNCKKSVLDIKELSQLKTSHLIRINK